MSICYHRSKFFPGIKQKYFVKKDNFVKKNPLFGLKIVVKGGFLCLSMFFNPFFIKSNNLLHRRRTRSPNGISFLDAGMDIDRLINIFFKHRADRLEFF